MFVAAAIVVAILSGPVAVAAAEESPSATSTIRAPSTGTTSPAPEQSELPRAQPESEDDDTDDRPGGLAGALWGSVREAIDDWFRSLARAALRPLVELLGSTVFASPDVTVPGTVRDFWLSSLIVADSLLVLLAVIGGVVLMGHETVQTSTTIKEIAPRLVFAVVAAHASLGIAGMLIRAANALSAGFLTGFEPESGHLAVEALIHAVLGVVSGTNVALSILGLVIAVLGIAVLCTYVARVATLVIMVGTAPLFLVAHAVPQLDGAARLWWRNLVGCLAVQVGQSLVMAAALRVFFHDDGRSLAGMPGGALMDLLVVASIFWLMLKIPTYAGRMIFAPRSSSSIGRQVGYRAASAAMGAVHKAAA